jgi:acyl-CoA reductase-like NAD-dependent aldehyde dehydrogenase
VAQATSIPPALQSFLDGKVKGLWIDNVYTEGSSGETIESTDPATGQVLAHVQTASSVDVDRAVASARRALEEDWRGTSPDERGRLLYRLSELVEANLEELALLETLDNGKPILASRREDVPAAAAVLRYFAGWATKDVGQVIPVSLGNFHCYTRHEPVGVCA